MFLVRSAFWLAVVVMLLPADKETGDKAPRVTAFEAISAAGTAVSDFSQFCNRHPEACATGGSAMHVFADKIRTGAKMLTGYFGDQKTGDKPNGTGRSNPTTSSRRGTHPTRAATPDEPSSQPTVLRAASGSLPLSARGSFFPLASASRRAYMALARD